MAIAGRTITIMLGSGSTAQTCTGTTDATGTASCSILVNQPLGPGTLPPISRVTLFIYHHRTVLPRSCSRSRRKAPLCLETRPRQVQWNSGETIGPRLTCFPAGPLQMPSRASPPIRASHPPAAAPGPPIRATAHSRQRGLCQATWEWSSPPELVSQDQQSRETCPRILVVTPNAGYGPDPSQHGTGTVVATYCTAGS